MSEVLLDYEGKRDRWNGYDPSLHFELIDSYNMVEQERQREKEENLLEGKGLKDEDIASSDDDEFKDTHEVQSGQKFDVKTRTTIRNLRIREDTAKYLWNLDPNSGYYDPKSRSMRSNPFPNADPKDLVFAGDNFIRMKGDAIGFKEIERFAWDTKVMEKGVHLQAAPSQAELFHRQFKEKKQILKNQTENEVLKKYVGDSKTKELSIELRLAQTEEYVEFAPDGRIIKGQEIQVTKSKYEEDFFPGNHKSVWGSYWENGQWGFSCCHAMIKNSYCTGELWKNTNLAATVLPPQNENGHGNASDAPKIILQSGEKQNGTIPSKKKQRKIREFGVENGGGNEKEESKNERKNFMEGIKSLKKEKTNERDHSYNSMYDIKDPTEEEMENYHRTKEKWDDPMKGIV